jgi:DNA-binding MarR family transcriptional regulator
MDLQVFRLAGLYRTALTAGLRGHPLFDAYDKLRPPSLGCLRIIATHGPISQREVADRVQVHASDMVALVDALEGYGLVHRERSPADRRRYDLTITDAGAVLVEHVARVAEQVGETFYSALSPAELEQLRALVERVVRANTTD